MQRRAAGSIFMASLPIARTDFRTKSTSISVAYLKHVNDMILTLKRTGS